jgi:cytochrome oxidase assembly protein ShyY1
MTGLRLDLEWRITALTAVLFPLLIGLGFWQLDRAEEKAALAEAFDARSRAEPAPLDEALWRNPPEQLAYLPVVATGRFVAGQHLLLDNRILDGRFGYEVVSQLELDNGSGRVLVNRGWLPGDAARLQLPEIPEVDGPVELSGHLYIAPGKPYLLAEQRLDGAWPRRLQALEMDKLAPALSAELGQTVAPYSLRIDAGQPGALAVAWQVVNVSPAKHRGYAVQWFTMAVVLLIFFFLRSSNLWQLLRGRGNETG